MNNALFVTVLNGQDYLFELNSRLLLRHTPVSDEVLCGGNNT